MRKNRTKRKDLKCGICDKVATHSVILELRSKPNCPPERKEVTHLVCDDHTKETNIDYWFPGKEFLKLIDDLRKRFGKVFWKQYSNIHMEKLQ